MDQTNAALAEVDAATNDVADKLDELANRVEANDAEVAELIRARAARLRTLAADPANPVPDEPA